MRKFFLGLMLSSALGAVVIGSALAWTSASNASANAQAGNIAFSVGLTGTGALVVDNNVAVNVANGYINNTGNTQLAVTSGSVSGMYACTSGAVVVDNGTYQGAGLSGYLFHVNLTMPSQGNDNSCMNIALPYTVTINVVS